jgi:transposase-like protein
MVFEEELNQLLQPGYSTFETGYHRLPNGQMVVAALTPMPGCRGRWVDWWFSNYIKDTETFRKWDPGALCFRWEENWKPGHYIGAKSYSELSIGPKVVRHRRIFDDPASIFNMGKLAEANIEAAICGEDFNMDGGKEGRVVHVARRTDFGCELRTRFWIDNGTEETAQEHLDFTIRCMSKLQDVLKILRKDTPCSEEETGTRCKFCQSNRIIKNGKYKNTQYWLCKDCGHCFTDNQCLPKMRYPPVTVATAVQNYFDGDSLGQICRNIEKNINIAPSTSTVYGWITKLAEKASEKTLQFQPRVGDNWILYETETCFRDRRYQLTYIVDIKTHFVLAANLSGQRDQSNIRALMILAREKAGKAPEVLLTNLDERFIKGIQQSVPLYSRPINISSFTGKESSSEFVHILPDMIKNRVKLEYDAVINAHCGRILSGFIFHHNFIKLPVGSTSTPANAACIEYPVKEWLDVINPPEINQVI